MTTMTLETKLKLLHDLPQRWRNQYYDSEMHCWNQLGRSGNLHSAQIEYEAIVDALNKHKHGELTLPEVEGAIAAAIGNTAWTTLQCSLCSSDEPRLVRIVRPDRLIAISICNTCLTAARLVLR